MNKTEFKPVVLVKHSDFKLSEANVNYINSKFAKTSFVKKENELITLSIFKKRFNYKVVASFKMLFVVNEGKSFHKTVNELVKIFERAYLRNEERSQN